MQGSFLIKSREQVKLAREAGRLTAEVLAMIKDYIVPGVTTDELDVICREFIVNELKAAPANIGYQGFPKTICASVNDVVCHGIPSARQLAEGDIINIDVAVIKDGWYGDSSRMYMIGAVDPMAKRLVDTTYEAMWEGIRTVHPGATLGDIGSAIQATANREKFSVVREYCGHGIGQSYHEAPQILHYGVKGRGMKLRPGMMFTIEPMLNAGTRYTKILDDGWTVVTSDGALSAQWEHMVVVTNEGVEVLTAWPDA